MIMECKSIRGLSSEKQFLERLFFELGRSGLRYCVLRNFESLPYSLGDSDLDLLIHPEDESKMIEIVHEVAASVNGANISSFKVEASIHCFCGYYNGQWWGVHIDVFPCLAHRGIDYYDVIEVVSSAEDWRGVRVAHEGHAYLTAFLKEYLAHGKDKKQYLNTASRMYKQNRDYYDEILRKYFCNDSVVIITSCLEEPKDRGRYMCLYKRVRRNLFFKALWKDIGQITTKLIIGWLRRIGRLVMPPGATIAILGTDGSGKSTIIDSIKPIIKNATHHEVFIEHMRPNLLPSIARLFGRPEIEGPTTDPHGSKPSGIPGSLMRLSYYSLDYIFGWWLKVFPRITKRSHFFIFDRYFYDYYIDPYRGRINLPKWIIKFYGLIVPSPDLILCLGTDPQILHARKSELPLKEVKRQVEKLQAFCKKNNRAVWIDTGCDIEESVNRVLEAITSKMAARYEK